MFYVYKVTITTTGQFYIGSQYNKKADPHQLGVTYFTSSDLVRGIIFEQGKSNVVFDVIEIFNDKSKCIKYEHILIKDSIHNPLCLNRQGDKRFRQIIKNAHVGGSYTERNINQSRRMKELWKTDEFRKKMTENRTGTRKISSEEREKKSLLMKELHRTGKCPYDNTSNSIWINNGTINKRWPKNDDIPQGYHKGRCNFIPHNKII